MENKQPTNIKKPLRIISVTGGKGGIGKTTISVNMAVAFAKMKKKVLLFDADLGLANVDILLGLTPQKTLQDFLQGNCQLNEVFMKGPHGLKIIPSSSGVQKMAELSATESAGLIHSFSALTDDIDIMIVDLASGISNQVIDFTHASQDILVVICNDPSSLMDSYAVIKILHQKYARNRFGIVVNKVRSLYEGQDVFSKFQETISKFINVNMNFLGHIPQDDFIGIAARERAAIVEQYPQSSAALAIKDLCGSIDQWHDDSELPGGIRFFFERLVHAD